MEINEKKLSRKTVLWVTLATSLVIILILTAVTVLMNDRSEDTPVSNIEVSSNVEYSSAADLTSNDATEEAISSETDASETFAETNKSEEASNEETSVSSENEDSPKDEYDESIEGWVINEYGYTYVYKDTGLEQFNFGMSTLNRYADSLNAMCALVPQDTRIFNITVPVSASFVPIPYEIRERDNYYNSYQSTFVSTTASKLDERITNIPIVSLIEEKYNNGEYVFYRSDRNWTQLGAYAAYTAFCENAGIQAYALEEFEQKEVVQFLGSFYIATKSKAMENNPDALVCYSTIPSVKTVMTVYDSGLIYENYKLCENKTSKLDAYNVFLGTNAGRYEINTTASGGSLLIVGDSSVYPMVPFLASHYNKIDVINPEYFGTSFEEYLANRQYDDVIMMCYSTNAVNGNFVPAFSQLTSTEDKSESSDTVTDQNSNSGVN